MKTFLLVLIVVIAAYGILQYAPKFFSGGTFYRADSSTSDLSLEKAFKNRLSGIQVGGSGRVIKILPDDTQGSRHQRFIVKLNSGQTLLIVHNIDIAPRIGDLDIGDQINFYGQYEWNAKGGLIHWTHHDPGGRHQAGWITHNGKIYQ